MLKRFFLILICAATVQQCTTNSNSESQANDTTSFAPGETQTDQNEAQAKAALFNPSLREIDTIFNLLVQHESTVKGVFMDASVVTESLLDVENPKSSENYIMILVHTGDGVYAGLREDIEYETEYSWLVVLREIAEGYEYVDHANLGESYSHGLVAGYTEGDAIELASGKFAAVIHSKSSEEGAGDYGYKRDNAQLFALDGNKILKIFDVNIEDSSFSSNEMGSWVEQNSTTELKVLDSETMGLYDLMTTTTESLKQSEPDDEEGGEVEESDEDATGNGSDDAEASSTDEPEDDGIDIYVWNGKEYVLKEN